MKTDNMSFCCKVALAKAKSVRTSFLSDLEEVIAKRPTRPGRKELRNRDKAKMGKNPTVYKSQKPSGPNSFPKKAAPQDSNLTGEEKAKKKEGNIDSEGKLSYTKENEEPSNKPAPQESQEEPSNKPAPQESQEENQPQEEDEEDFDDDNKSTPKLTAIRSIDNPYLVLVNFRNTDEEKSFFQKIQPMLTPSSAIVFYRGKKNDPELSQFYAFIVAGSKQGDFTNRLGNLNNDTQAFPEELLNHDASFDDLTFGPEFKKLGVNEKKVKRELNEVIRQMGVSNQGQVSALRMMSEIPIDYIRFLNSKHDQRQFYIGGNPPNAGTKGTRLVLCDEDESSMFLKVMGHFKPTNTFFNDLYFVNDIDPDFKDYKPFNIIPARALLLEAKTKFELDKEVEVEGGGKVELFDGNTGKPIKPTQSEFLKRFVQENLFNIAKQGSWKKARYYEGDNWIHLNRDHTKAILWGSRTKSISLSKNDILETLPFVKNVNLTFLK